MVTPNEFFTEEEKVHLANLVSAFSNEVHDQETFDKFLLNLRIDLSHDEATKLLAMSTAVISAVSISAISKAAAMIIATKVMGN